MQCQGCVDRRRARSRSIREHIESAVVVSAAPFADGVNMTTEFVGDGGVRLPSAASSTISDRGTLF